MKNIINVTADELVKRTNACLTQKDLKKKDRDYKKLLAEVLKERGADGPSVEVSELHFGPAKVKFEVHPELNAYK